MSPIAQPGLKLSIDRGARTLSAVLDRKFPLSSSHGNRRFVLAWVVGQDVLCTTAFMVFAKKGKAGTGAKWRYKNPLIAVDDARAASLAKLRAGFGLAPAPVEALVSGRAAPLGGASDPAPVPTPSSTRPRPTRPSSSSPEVVVPVSVRRSPPVPRKGGRFPVAVTKRCYEAVDQDDVDPDVLSGLSGGEAPLKRVKVLSCDAPPTPDTIIDEDDEDADIFSQFQDSSDKMLIPLLEGIRSEDLEFAVEGPLSSPLVLETPPLMSSPLDVVAAEEWALPSDDWTSVLA